MTLECPAPDCDDVFHTYHDEHQITTLVRHLDKEHEAIYNNLKTKLCQ